jgi:hypothetical protein
MSDPFGGEDRRFTKAEVADLIETRVRAAAEIANAFPAHALLIKTLDKNLSTDPFGGAMRDEGHTLQKRARSQFYGLKKLLNEDELQIVRSYFAANPSILSLFEGGRVAVRFENGRLAGYNLGA